MGADKAFLRLTDTGPRLIELVLHAVRAVADEVTIVTNDDRLDFLGVRTTPDQFPGSGALGGIYSALLAAQHEHCLVVACDMPFLSPKLLAAMAAVPRDYDVLAPLLPVTGHRQASSGGVYETLHAIYGRAALPAMRSRLVAGDYKIVGFFPDVRVVPFPIATIRRIDPTLRSFFNANTPARLAEARATRG